MGIGNRLYLHLMDKGFANQARGIRLARELTEDAPTALQVGAVVIGAFAGSVYGGIQLINPASIADSALSSEDDLEKKVDKAFEEAYKE